MIYGLEMLLIQNLLMWIMSQYYVEIQNRKSHFIIIMILLLRMNIIPQSQMPKSNLQMKLALHSQV